MIFDFCKECAYKEDEFSCTKVTCSSRVERLRENEQEVATVLINAEKLTKAIQEISKLDLAQDYTTNYPDNVEVAYNRGYNMSNKLWLSEVKHILEKYK